MRRLTGRMSRFLTDASAANTGRIRAAAAPVVERLEGRALYCAVHGGIPDIFDPTGRALGDGGAAPTYVARVNFGPAETAAVPGYARDDGGAFGAKPAGPAFGWTAGGPVEGRV